MNGIESLQQNINQLKSRMGRLFLGERVIFRGEELHTHLKDMDWMALYIFGITGRKFTPEQIRLLHAIWTYTSYPDARLWNNRVAGLAGAARSTNALGIAAALAVSEASIYGGGILTQAINFFVRTHERIKNGHTLASCVQEELKAYRKIGGYGRPIISSDERIAPMLALAKQLGLDQGPYLRLAFEVEDFLIKGRWRLHINYAALVAALGADLGLNPQEFSLFMFPVFLAGMQPCFIEAAQRPEGALFPLAPEHIAYHGHAKRIWSKPP